MVAHTRRIALPTKELTINGAASEAGCSRWLIRHYVQKGTLPAEKRPLPAHGAIWILDRAAFDGWRTARQERLVRREAAKKRQSGTPPRQ